MKKLYLFAIKKCKKNQFLFISIKKYIFQLLHGVEYINFVSLQINVLITHYFKLTNVLILILNK